MRFQRAALLPVFLLMFLTPCFAHHMAVVVNKENKVENITALHLGKMLRTGIKKWPDGKAVILVLHKDSEAKPKRSSA